MPYPFGTQKDSIIEIDIRIRSISECLPGMKNQRQVKALFLDTPFEVQKGFDIMNQGVEAVLMPYQIKSCGGFVLNDIHSKRWRRQTSNQVWKLLFELYAIIRALFKFLNRYESKRGVDEFRPNEFISSALCLQIGLDFFDNIIKDSANVAI